MLKVDTVRDWLASYLTTDTIYAGFVDENIDACLAIYQRDAGAWEQAIGADSTIQTFHGKVLVRWGKDIKSAETKVAAVFDAIRTHRSGTIGTYAISDVLMSRPPINIGRDSRGIWESVIVFIMRYEEV